MPTYTMELYRVLDLKPSDTEEDAWLGLDDYPLHEPEHREDLNTKIKNHFMFQEIGLETVSQFRFAMRRKMHEIMPVYNELFRSAAVQYDVLSTVDLRTTATGEQKQTSEGTTLNESDTDIDSVAKNVVSNFPQVMLSGNADYASNGADSNSQTATKATVDEKSEAESTATNESDSRTFGYQGVPSQLVQAFRAAIINVDMLIIRELDELFMLTWGNSDEFSTTNGRLI